MGVRTVNDTDLGAVWRAATDELADEIVSAQQRAYLRLTRLRAIVEDTALLSVPDAFTRDVIESKLRPAITEALSRRLGRAIQVAVTVRAPEEAPPATYLPPATQVPAARVPEPTLFDAATLIDGVTHYPPPPVEVAPAVAVPPPPPPPLAHRAPVGAGTGRDDQRRHPVPGDGNRLNPKYMFETFVIGSSNRFAHAASVAVAESPAKAYN